jgi:hypothetical protein
MTILINNLQFFDNFFNVDFFISSFIIFTSFYTMPQFSPLWFINLISWTFAIISFVVWYSQSITFPSIIRLNLSRIILTNASTSTVAK